MYNIPFCLQFRVKPIDASTGDQMFATKRHAGQQPYGHATGDTFLFKLQILLSFIDVRILAVINIFQSLT